MCQVQWLSFSCLVTDDDATRQLAASIVVAARPLSASHCGLEWALHLVQYGIMKDLHDSGLHWRLPTFIEGFRKNRQFRVKVGSSFSQLYDQEMGVPQGSILSVTLFGLKINPIIKSIASGVECSLYVDDFLICYRSKYINVMERYIQRCLNKLSNWKIGPFSTKCSKKTVGSWALVCILNFCLYTL